jgi:hypothetical protein
MKQYTGEWKYSSNIIHLSTRWKRVVRFTLRSPYSWGKHPGIHWEGDWVGLRAGLDIMEKKKIFLARAGNRTPVIQHVTRRYTD